jgi:RES domain-containing protein
MAKRKNTKGQTTIYKALHIKNEWHEPHLATSHCFPDLMELEQRVYSDCRSHNIFHPSSAMNCQSNTLDANSWAEKTRSPPCVSGIHVVHFVKF